MLEEYEINKNTLVVMPYGEESSRVIETGNNFLVNKKTSKIIDDSCKFFGSSYKGRFQGTKRLTGIKYKSPIIVEETSPIIIFPTDSPRSEGCCWVNLKNVEKYFSNEYGTKVRFNNGLSIVMNISYNSFDNQILRASRLYQILNQRKNG